LEKTVIPVKKSKPEKKLKCPLCGGAAAVMLDDTETYYLYLCRACGSNFQHRKKGINKAYDESYFRENHRKAYGVSYIEDEANIRDFAKRRLKILKHLLRNNRGKSLSLLDGGSALGLFCDEAAKAGFHAEGAEISAFARKFAGKNFGIKSYADFNKVPGKFDCVTLWFTLEHIDKPVEWIQKARKLLNKGGIMALAVPHGRGAFALLNRSGYLKARPVEHYFEPSINGMTVLLNQNGFQLKETAIFGLHPERAGLPKWGIIKLIQKILCLGDTFEIYARKIEK
jgi:2-polyprenyl-3-methyl-5-hydroxy-6-metoxy-1,4-benzoquinol methylase